MSSITNNYHERRKNNVVSIRYENDYGDEDLFSYNPSNDTYTVVRDFDEELNQLAFKIDRRDLPKLVRDSLDSERVSISEMLE